MERRRLPPGGDRGDDWRASGSSRPSTPVGFLDSLCGRRRGRHHQPCQTRVDTANRWFRSPQRRHHEETRLHPDDGRRRPARIGPPQVAVRAIPVAGSPRDPVRQDLGRARRREPRRRDRPAPGGPLHRRQSRPGHATRPGRRRAPEPGDLLQRAGPYGLHLARPVRRPFARMGLAGVRGARRRDAGDGLHQGLRPVRSAIRHHAHRRPRDRAEPARHGAVRG